MNDTEIAAVVHRGVELLQGEGLRHSERIKVDGLWVVVRVMRADSQQERAPEETADVVVE